MLDRFRDRGFEVIAINLEPTQRKEVLPLLAATHISFVPLESDWEWGEKTYGVTGTPTAMLVDRQGRIVFKPDVHDNATRLVLERQVEALLDRPSTR